MHFKINKFLLPGWLAVGSLMFGSLDAQSALWTNRYNGAGDNADRYNQMVTDASGNLYCAGYTVRAGQGKDFLVAKLNVSGDTVWTRTYNHTANLDDEANFIALDASGDLIVAGYSDAGSSSTKTDILLAKYSALGVLQWTTRYNYDTANEDDLPAGMHLDAAGNIFLTGRSDHDANNIDDCVTLKFSSAGTLQWASRYDGGDTDRGAGIVADQSGGCIITGRTFNGVNDDIITIAYSSAGATSWQMIFAGPAGDDRGQAIGRDATGNIYVAGIRANVDDDDYVTLKYNATGLLQWTKIFNGVDNDRIATLKLDASGNAIVTGQSDIDAGGNANYDFRTIAYSPAGTILWNVVTGNPVGQEDVPGDMYIDASGNVYVTGKSDAAGGGSLDYEWMTVKYNSTGVQQWVKYYNGTTPNAEDIPATIYADAAGNVWVVGSIDFAATQKDASALRYTTAGVLNATKTFNGQGDFNDKVQASVTDAAGNTYLTGYTMVAGQQRNMLVQKIDPSGVTAWTRTYDGTGENDEGLAIETDALGNVYVAGYSNGTGTYDDALLIKYNSLGVMQWVQVYDHTAHQLDKLTALTISSLGDIYVTGYSDGDASTVVNYDIATWKYSSIGLLQWTSRFNGVGNSTDKPADIVWDGTNLYIAGTSFNTNNDIVVLQYDALGTLIAQTTYNGASNGDDIAYDLLLDGSDLYISGSSFVSGNLEDYLTLKYNATLSMQWFKNYNGTGDQMDIAYGLAATGTEVYVTGSSIGTSGAADIALVKYNKSTGAQNWAKRYTGAGAYADEGFSVVTDGAQNIYTTGRSANATTVADFISLNYTPSGAKQLTLKYNGNGSKEDVAREAMLDSYGYLHISGYSTGSGKNNFDFTTIKYCTPIPSASITAAGATTICVGLSVVLNANTGVGLTYQWKKGNANIAGATLSSYSATTSGAYKCVVSNSNGCSATSNTINVTTIICREGDELPASTTLPIGPNPFVSAFTINTSNITAETHLTLLDLSGRLLQELWVTPGVQEVEMGQDLPAGTYVLYIHAGNEREVVQLVKM